MFRPAANGRREGKRSRAFHVATALAVLALADGAVNLALAQRSDSWFGRSAQRPVSSTETDNGTDISEARDQAEAARLYGDARKSIERGHLQDARNRLELLLSRYRTSHLAEIAKRDLKAVYEKLASQLDTPSPAPPVPAARVEIGPPPGPQPVRPAGDGFRTARQPLDPQPSAIFPTQTRPSIPPQSPQASPTAKAIDFLKDEFRNTAGDRIFFTEGSVDFGTRARMALEAQASWLLRNPGVHVLIEGHADDGPGRDINRDISLRRVEAAKAKLVELGIDPARIEVVALGRERPVSDCNAPACANQNRVVVTTISRVNLAASP